jgi:hypothetical protein
MDRKELVQAALKLNTNKDMPTIHGKDKLSEGYCKKSYASLLDNDKKEAFVTAAPENDDTKEAVVTGAREKDEKKKTLLDRWLASPSLDTKDVMTGIAEFLLAGIEPSFSFLLHYWIHLLHYAGSTI